MTVFFATPCHRGSEKLLAEIAQWNATTSAALGLKGACGSIVSNCPWLDAARADLVSHFLKSDCRWLFFRDDDNFIEPKMLQRMIDADKPILVAPYKTRTPPYNWTVRLDAHGHVAAAGLGVTLIRRDVIDRLYANNKSLEYRQNGELRVALFMHMLVPHTDGTQLLLKEDHAFFWRVREAGYTIETLRPAEVRHGDIESTWP
jgi:hypothetical protein